MSDIKVKIADIVNKFIQDNRLVNADLCNDEEEFKGLHSGLTIGGANEIVDYVEALIQEQVRLARISELKQLEPPEQYEEYARIAGTDACYICGFNAVLFRKVIAERIKALKGDK